MIPFIRCMPSIFVALAFGLGTAQQQSLHVDRPPLELAPAPRAASLNRINGGVVTGIDKTHIAVRGMHISVDGIKKSEAFAIGREKCFSHEGPTLTIRGSFPTLIGVRVASDAGGDYVVTHHDGTTTEIRLGDQPERKFTLSDVLRAGYPGTGGRGNRAYTYRITDVKVGDTIQMHLRNEFSDEPVCDAILITRRPGGRVPPAPSELEEPGRRGEDRPFWHDRMNAIQDWEERGIPLPYHLHPGDAWPRLGHWPQLAPPPRSK